MTKIQHPKKSQICIKPAVYFWLLTGHFIVLVIGYLQPDIG